MGRNVPAKARTNKKKNSQRGPTVGKVLKISNITPPQPMMKRKIDNGMKNFTGGVGSFFMF